MKNRADFLGLIFFSKFVVKHYVFDHHQFLIFSFAIFSWYFPKENTILPINLILHHFFPLFPFSAGPLQDLIFSVSNSTTSAISRLVKANKSISYKKLSLFFPSLYKGDLVVVKELPFSTDFFFQDRLLLSLPKSNLKSSLARKVKKDGSILLSRRRFFLNLPKDSLVLVSKTGDSFCFFSMAWKFSLFLVNNLYNYLFDPYIFNKKRLLIWSYVSNK